MIAGRKRQEGRGRRRHAGREEKRVGTAAANAEAEKVNGLFDLEAARRTLETQRDQGRTLEEILRDLQASENRG